MLIRQYIVITLLYLLGSACGPSTGVGSKKNTSAANATPTTIAIKAFGDGCQQSSVATTLVGFNARIALQITGATESSHTLGFVGNAQGLRLNFNEAILVAPAVDGVQSFMILLRNRNDCQVAAKNGRQINCELNYGPVPQADVSDIQQKISFVISKSVGEFVNSGTIGKGQTGVVGDILNGQGLMGFLGKLGMLSNLGGGITGALDSATVANQQLAQAKAMADKPNAGCAGTPQTATTTPPSNMPTTTTTTTSTSTGS